MLGELAVSLERNERRYQEFQKKNKLCPHPRLHISQANASPGEGGDGDETDDVVLRRDQSCADLRVFQRKTIILSVWAISYFSY